MSKYETLGDWCKYLEHNFSPEIMIPKLPVIIRLDGNNFSTWTKGLNKPFDPNLTQLMVDLTKYLVEETNAVIGYTQSDEITLILYSSDKNTEIYHNGKKQKILSKLTGKAVTFFNERRRILLPNHDKLANFDCRIYQTPTLEDACAQLIWRENDATRNSISMLGRAYFSHNEVENKKMGQVQDMLMNKFNINWNDIEVKHKRGTYIKRIKRFDTYTKEELNALPEKHQARVNPELVIERNQIIELELPILTTIINRVGVIFKNEQPITNSDKNPF